jgi:hypothetical protein
MIGNDDHGKFEEMWTWLIAFPALDRNYFIKHVAKKDKGWLNNCPLSNSEKLEECTGCQSLWDSPQGNLCTDSSSPLYKWKKTDKDQPDKRSSYASKIAVLARKANYQFELHTVKLVSDRKTSLGHPLPMTDRYKQIE